MSKEKRKAEELRGAQPLAGYVYWSEAYIDLMEMVTEYLGESEHIGNVPDCREVSSDTIVDVKEWIKVRKEELQEDFVEYWKQEQIDNALYVKGKVK